MQDLTIVGVEDGALLVSSGAGDRYRLAVDESLRTSIRAAARGSTTSGEQKVAPREIQAHIRGGMSAEDVASITGASLDYVQKFEGPVLAEREYVIESALAVRVHTAIDLDPMLESSTFGSVIHTRLADLGATGERWASWKEPAGGWVVKLSFSAADVEHDARWQYEPKRSALSPLNGEANTLSQQGEMPGALIPRLRAVGGDERAQDQSRFDSGAFDVSRIRSSERTTMPQPIGRGSVSSPDVAAAAISRAPVDESGSSQTADLLEALRRRRGERETATWGAEDDPRSDHPSTGSSAPGATGRVRLVDVPLDTFDDESLGGTGVLPDGSETTGSGGRSSNTRRGRAAMPSWDEIVFGARSDDDPA